MWAIAAGVVLFTAMAISLADFTELAYAALRGSVAAIWFVPAVLLLWRAPGIGTWVGLLLVANCVRLLVSFRVPGGRGRAKDAGTGGSIFAAFALQAGLFSAASGNWILGAALVGIATAIWIRSSIARGAYVPAPPRAWAHLLLSTVLAVLVLAAPPSGSTPGGSPAGGDSPGNLARVLDRLFPKAPEQSKRLTEPPPKQILSHLESPPKPAAPAKELGKRGANGFPGAILRPEGTSTRPTPVFLPGRGGGSFSGNAAVVIPFTGEYRLYPSSFPELPPGSVIFHDSPLDTVYVTLIDVAMLTEAYQRFDPPIDFSRCGKVRLTFRSGEDMPASATMLLVMAGRNVQLEQAFFGLDPRPEETLEFAVPQSVQGLVGGVRVLFQRSPREAMQNTRIEVKSLELAPRP